MRTFVCFYPDEFKNMVDVELAVGSYLTKAHLTDVCFLRESLSVKVTWKKREVGNLLLRGAASPGDALVIYEAGDVGRSTAQMLEILIQAAHSQVAIHFVKHGQVFSAQSLVSRSGLMDILRSFDEDYLIKRSTDAITRRRSAGLSLGRPKGRQNKSLKLDRCHKDIVNYLNLGISKSSIAKLVRCHPQTLYDWIERNSVPDRRPRRPRKKLNHLELGQVSSVE